jgi:S-adenosylmethionine synthetase
MIKVSEHVSPLHPDKQADILAGKIGDALTEKSGRKTRFAIEVLAGHGEIDVIGEVGCPVRQAEAVIKGILDVDYPEYEQRINLVEQSSEIAQGVDTGGAGDQSIVTGYYNPLTPTGNTYEHYLAKSLNDFIFEKHHEDGKTLIGVNDFNSIEVALISFANVKKTTLENYFNEWLSKSTKGVAKNYELFTNPAGDWTSSGLDADTGLTGRKLAVDFYGPNIPIGGGALAGKDFTKPDVAGALYARKIAKDISDYLAEPVRTQLSFGIGVKNALSVSAYLSDGITEVPKHVIPNIPSFSKMVEWARQFSYEDVARQGVEVVR